MGDERTWLLRRGGQVSWFVDEGKHLPGDETVEVCPLSRAEAAERERDELRERIDAALRENEADEVRALESMPRHSANGQVAVRVGLLQTKLERLMAAVSKGATREEQT